MNTHLAILAISFSITITSIPFIIRIAFKTKFLDSPDGDPLKIHRKPVPVLGGMAIFLAVTAGLLIGSILREFSKAEVIGLLFAMSILFLLGLIDDAKGLKPWPKLLGQSVAAGVIILASNYFSPYGITSFILSFLCILLFINAMNLLDGIDGLASGVTLVATVGFLWGFVKIGNGLGTVLSLTLIGACSGFLLYNFNPARIFLGDNGSTVLGFLLGVLAILYSKELSVVSGYVFPVLVLIVPLCEIGSTIFRRLQKRHPLFYGDRDHIYDFLICKGLSQKQTTLLICGFGLFGILLAVNLLI